VHFTAVDGDKITKTDFCEECTDPLFSREEGFELMGIPELLKSEEPQIMAKESVANIFRFPPGAYEFVKESLNESRRPFGAGQVPARELLEGMRALALRRFGKGAKGALAKWQIFKTEDFGEIVFEMIEAGWLTKRPEDSQKEFANVFDFDEAFPDE